MHWLKRGLLLPLHFFEAKEKRSFFPGSAFFSGQRKDLNSMPFFGIKEKKEGLVKA